MEFIPIEYIAKEGFQAYMEIYDFDKTYKFYGHLRIGDGNTWKDQNWHYDFFECKIDKIGFDFSNWDTDVITTDGRMILISMNEKIEMI